LTGRFIPTARVDVENNARIAPDRKYRSTISRSSGDRSELWKATPAAEHLEQRLAREVSSCWRNSSTGHRRRTGGQALGQHRANCTVARAVRDERQDLLPAANQLLDGGQQQLLTFLGRKSANVSTPCLPELCSW
jgi:hypothetical protein